jgi:hypothetical protein
MERTRMNRRSRKMRKWRRKSLAKERERDGGGVEKQEEWKMEKEE